MPIQDRTPAGDHLQQVQIELVNVLYRLAGTSLIGHVVLAILSVVVAWGRLSDALLLLWMGLMCVLIVARLILIRQYWRGGRESGAASGHWVRWFAVSAGLTGCLWGAFGLMFLLADDRASLPYITGAILSGVLSAAVTPLSAYRSAYVVYALPTMLPYVIACFIQDDLPVMIFGVMAVLLLGVNLFYSQKIYSALFEAIRLRYENVELLAKLKLETAAANAARDEAQAATTAKSKFLAAASHDLRQPVHAMSLFLDALAFSGPSAHQQALIRNTQTASQAAKDMLNSLLDFSKVDAGVMKPLAGAFPLQPLLQKLENELRVQADEKKLAYRSRPTRLAAFADASLTEQILRNFISNAIRYTGTGGVLIGCRIRKCAENTMDGDQVVVEVWDTGMGIPAGQIEKIFDEFYQISNPERDRQKGLGLGLAIVKGIAGAMGAKVTLASVPGRGSVFRLHLPLFYGVVGHEIQDAPLLTDFGGRHVLVVDDDRIALEGMRALLEQWHCSVATAMSMEEAVMQMDARMPDLIISDYRLREGVTGREVIAALRRRAGVDLPCIIITGDTAPDRLREAMAIDAMLLHKPVSTRELSIAMTGLLED
jgi:two-component system, sensor histidine kinase